MPLQRNRRDMCSVALIPRQLTAAPWLALPTACRSYWIGYKAVVWGANFFKPLDKTMPGPPYNNWAPGEPNGRLVPEMCLVADSNTAGQNGSFAWADSSCYNTRPFMCRVMGRRPLSSSQPHSTRAASCSDSTALLPSRSVSNGTWWRQRSVLHHPGSPCPSGAGRRLRRSKPEAPSL